VPVKPISGCWNNGRKNRSQNKQVAHFSSPSKKALNWNQKHKTPYMTLDFNFGSYGPRKIWYSRHFVGVISPQYFQTWSSGELFRAPKALLS
jgi:hypothetical protein